MMLLECSISKNKKHFLKATFIKKININIIANDILIKWYEPQGSALYPNSGASPGEFTKHLIPCTPSP
jgi:hypothetical protein